MNIPRTIAVLLLTACICATASAAAFIKIDGIEGEAKDKAHAGWIEVDSRINLDVKTPRDAATGMATGRRTFEPVVIRKRIDKSSPLLAKAMAGKQVIRRIEISNQGARHVLSDVVVSSITTANGMETVSFSYQKIEVQPAAAVATPRGSGVKEKAQPPPK